MFKKGDRVRLKKDFDPDGHRVRGAFVPQMDKYIGKTFIVEEMGGTPTFNYVLNDNWAFRFDWLELADDSQTESVFLGSDTKSFLEGKSLLLEADMILNGYRDADYGDPVENFKRISRIASAILNKDITDEECCVVMIAVKLARENYKHKRDNVVDGVAYMEILNRIKESR